MFIYGERRLSIYRKDVVAFMDLCVYIHSGFRVSGNLHSTHGKQRQKKGKCVQKFGEKGAYTDIPSSFRPKDHFFFFLLERKRREQLYIRRC